MVSLVKYPLNKLFNWKVPLSNVILRTITQSPVIKGNQDQGLNSFDQQGQPDILFRQIELEASGHDRSVLNSYEYFAVRAAKNLNIHFEKSWEPPKLLERYTILKSVHIFKKHRVQYEMRTYLKVMQFKYLTGSTADTFLEYVERNLPEGVALKVTKYAIEQLPDSIISEAT